jgi:hypothetical protein
MTAAEPVTVSAPTARPGWPSGVRQRRLLWVVFAVGFALRAPLYFANPSLLLDEARVALNIASHDFAGLTLPLDYDQTAPVLFLWGAKALTLVFGPSEYAMRAIPFMAGLALLPLTWFTVRRVAGVSIALLATTFAATSPLYLQYVRQVKPYTLDGVVALLLLWLALDLLDASVSRRSWLRLTAAGVVACWLSTPAALVLAGTGSVLWFAPRGERPPRGRLVLAAAAWVLSFVPAYLFIYRPVAQNRYMQQFWGGSILTLWEPGVGFRAWQATREFVWQIFGGGSTEPPLKLADHLAVDGVVLTMVVLGIWGVRSMARQCGFARPLLLIAPLGGAFAASLVGGYPIAGRTMLFAAPGMIAVAAGGTMAVLESLRPQWRTLGSVLAIAALLGPSLPLDRTLATHPLAFEHMRPAVAEYERRSGYREPIYVFTAALPSWTFYTTDWSHPDYERLARMNRLGSSTGPAFENAAPRSRPMLPEDSVGMRHALRATTELIGAYSGAQWRSGIGTIQFHPDTNWAVHEGRRIADAAQRGGAVWVLVIRTLGLERQLFEEAGLCVDSVYRGRGVLLVRFVRPSWSSSDRPQSFEMSSGSMGELKKNSPTLFIDFENVYDTR